MPNTAFCSTSFTLPHLVDNIARGDVALPELQRPFVWSNSKVRDLFDSMFQGIPVGYLLFWETGAEVEARQIGVAERTLASPDGRSWMGSSGSPPCTRCSRGRR